VREVSTWRIDSSHQYPLGALPEIERDAKQAEALALLALIAGQDVEWIDEDSAPAGGQWRIARRVAEDRVISVHDPEARHAHKTVARRQDGFKAHVVVEPDTGIVIHRVTINRVEAERPAVPGRRPARTRDRQASEIQSSSTISECGATRTGGRRSGPGLP